MIEIDPLRHANETRKMSTRLAMAVKILLLLAAILFTLDTRSRLVDCVLIILSLLQRLYSRCCIETHSLHFSLK